ncbi:endonuclease/exonuclease/phosphatase family protein [uncultured Paracoccus sp.]|uniref:endonuclease/exonuclease/phosphatase family protein n=1 Tax=uncultured Paracoccus sp. TaxID=189685 RepID=UPI002639C1CE|nr:endonuclease/exonuclease/phosphatase family protein [uncultured Paracoccus sp.]
MRSFSSLPRVVAAVCLAALALSYAGPVHPLGDSLAVFRPIWAGALLLAALGLRGLSRLGAVTLSAAALLSMGQSLLASEQGPDRGAPIRIYQKNLRYDVADTSRFAADIRTSDADLVMLQEVSAQNRSLPQALSSSHPYQLVCVANAIISVAVLSRWPFAEPPVCPDHRGLTAVRVSAPGGDLTAAALHMHWPWPFGQGAQVPDLLPQLKALPQPVVLGGDFNMVPWGHAARAIQEATGTRRVGPVRPSFMLLSVYPIAIDHVLVPEGWHGEARMRPRLGSDHRGIAVEAWRE